MNRLGVFPDGFLFPSGHFSGLIPLPLQKKTSTLNALFTTAYFPPLDYMATLLNSRHIYIEAHETYSKQSWRNRCMVATANGLQNLIVPVNKIHGRHTTSKDVKISYTENWQQLHWRTLTAAYNKSPYFEHYSPLLKPYFIKQTEYLFELNLSLLKLVLNLLRIDQPISITTVYEKKPSGMRDYRSHFKPKAKLVDQTGTPYYQVFADRIGFQPNLSILDLLFCEGPLSVDYLRKLNQDRQS